MKSLCLFASYLPSNNLPYYVKVYLEELKKHFSEVHLLGHVKLESKDEEYLKQSGIHYSKELNEGYDFGLWYKALKAIDVQKYDRIALVNDSCILFKPLTAFMNWANREPAQVLGMSLSEAVSTHMQSYFLVLNKQAIAPALLYFHQHGILTNLPEVIRTYEIGLSRYLFEKGLSFSAFADNEGYQGEFSPYYHFLDHHLKQGVPLIKKKVIFSSYRNDELFTLARMNFKIASNRYLKLIFKDPLCFLNREELMKDVNGALNRFQKTRYEMMRLGIQTYKTFKKLFIKPR
ncbi:MAG: rhamnan synthesis F family protein [Bacteroidia bacterium]|jgi:lipopolysaccharide biosynthesis protein|nr:rhamnan synthesis F family protein [Bacteroidia bacterium]